MTLLELFSASAPAGVVATDLLLVRDDALLGHRHHRRYRGVPPGAGCGHRLGTGERLVLVGEAAVPDGLGLLVGLELLRVFRRELGVEEREDDLLADLPAELLEHLVAFAAVLDERILLRHRP